MKISIKHNNTKLKTDDVELAGMFLAKIAKESQEECCDEDLTPEEKVRIVAILHGLKEHLKGKFEENKPEPAKEEVAKPKPKLKPKPIVKTKSLKTVTKKTRLNYTPWTIEEDLIIFNCLKNKMIPKEISLLKELNRHTRMAVRTRASVIYNKDYKNMNSINAAAIKTAYKS